MTKYNISSIFTKNKKKIKNNDKPVITEKSTKRKNILLKQEKNQENDDYNSLFDIESEHKNSIKIKNFGYYQVNKPHDYNMKFSKYNDNEEDNNDTDNKKAEKIIIGNIEGYQDIIESDKLKYKNEMIKNRNNNKFNNNLIINNKECPNTNEKVKIDKITKYLEKLKIMEDNFSELYDFNLGNNYCKTNENLMIIEKEYEFEDLSTNENESKFNKLLMLSESQKNI